MQIEIPCETYIRMANIPATLEKHRKNQYLKSLYIERKNNIIILVATNISVAAVEMVGEQQGPDEAFAITIDPVLIKQAETESSFNGKLSIVNNEILNFTSIKTTLGYNYPGNAGVMLPNDHDFKDWRAWFPDALPSKSKGYMYFLGQALLDITNASPSGALVFPQHIDASMPVTVRDAKENDWFGLFLPTDPDGPSSFNPIPEWCK